MIQVRKTKKDFIGKDNIKDDSGKKDEKRFHW